MDQTASMQKRVKGLLPELLGIRFVSVAPERVVAELEVRDDLCTVPGILHGGAIMALADTLGTVSTVLWQTNVRSPEGKLLAQLTQTQFVGSPG